MLQLAYDYPLPKLLLEHRSLSKLKSTYTDKLPLTIAQSTGRVHLPSGGDGDWAFIVDRSELAEYSDPEEGRRFVRHLLRIRFIKLSRRLPQIELRIMAHLSEDEGLLWASRSGYHRATAAEIMGIEPDAVTSDQGVVMPKPLTLVWSTASAFGLAETTGHSASAKRSVIWIVILSVIRVLTYRPNRTQQGGTSRFMLKHCLVAASYLPDIKAKNMGLRKAAERAGDQRANLRERRRWYHQTCRWSNWQRGSRADATVRSAWSCRYTMNWCLKCAKTSWMRIYRWSGNTWWMPPALKCRWMSALRGDNWDQRALSAKSSRGLNNNADSESYRRCLFRLRPQWHPDRFLLGWYQSDKNFRHTNAFFRDEKAGSHIITKHHRGFYVLAVQLPDGLAFNLSAFVNSTRIFRLLFDAHSSICRSRSLQRVTGYPSPTPVHAAIRVSADIPIMPPAISASSLTALAHNRNQASGLNVCRVPAQTSWSVEYGLGFYWFWLIVFTGVNAFSADDLPCVGTTGKGDLNATVIVGKMTNVRKTGNKNAPYENSAAVYPKSQSWLCQIIQVITDRRIAPMIRQDVRGMLQAKRG